MASLTCGHVTTDFNGRYKLSLSQIKGEGAWGSYTAAMTNRPTFLVKKRGSKIYLTSLKVPTAVAHGVSTGPKSFVAKFYESRPDYQFRDRSSFHSLQFEFTFTTTTTGTVRVELVTNIINEGADQQPNEEICASHFTGTFRKR